MNDETKEQLTGNKFISKSNKENELNRKAYQKGLSLSVVYLKS